MIRARTRPRARHLSTLGLLWAIAIQGCASWAPVSRSPPLTTVKPVQPKTRPRPKPRAEHPVIVAYKSSLVDVLSDEEKAQLSEMDLSGTVVGDVQRLRYLAADHAIRVFLPAALEATKDPLLRTYAKRIRALPPLLNTDTDAVAYEVVSAALQARKRWQRGEMPTLEETMMAVRGPERADDDDSDSPVVLTDALSDAPEGEQTEVVEGTEATPLRALHDDEEQARQEYADALANYAEVYARVYNVDSMQADSAAAAAADAADAAVVLQQAISAGANRQILVEQGLGLLEAMAEAARRRERIPIPKLKKPPPKDDVPDNPF